MKYMSCTPQLYGVLPYTLIRSQILTPGSAFLPFTALLYIFCTILGNSQSYIFLPGSSKVPILLNQAHAAVYHCLSPKPCRHISQQQRDHQLKETNLQTTQFQGKQVKVFYHLVIHHLF